jgi:CHAD domain-containing protein
VQSLPTVLSLDGDTYEVLAPKPKKAFRHIALALSANLKASFKESCTDSHLILYDSFDWRLQRKGKQLWLHQGVTDPGTLFLLSKEASTHLRQPIQDIPILAQDLPLGLFRDALVKWLEMRALEAKCDVRVRETCLSWEMCDLKEPLTLSYRRLHVKKSAKKKWKRLPTHIQNMPTHTCVLTTKNPLTVLRNQPHLNAIHFNLTDSTLNKLSIEPSTYEPKVDITFHDKLSPAEAIHQILTFLWKVQRRYEAGLVAYRDTEYLHQYRVALRKARSLISLSKDLLCKKDLSLLRRHLRWIGQATGPLRDLDVICLHFPVYTELVPKNQVTSLTPFKTYLLHERQKHHGLLVKLLGEEPYEYFVKSYDSFLRKPRKLKAKAPLSLGSFVPSATNHAVQNILREGRAINDSSPDTDLHTLRKLCKRCRYLFEFFQSLHPHSAESMVSKLKKLQELLGDFQDLSIHRHLVNQWLLISEEQASSQALAATRYLDTALRSQQARLRQDFHSLFAEFSRHVEKDHKSTVKSV